MANASRLPLDSTFERPRRPSLLAHALRWLRRRPADREPRARRLRVMFSTTRIPRGSGRDHGVADASDPKQMRADLKLTLNRVSGSRYVLRHLAMIEHDLKTHGVAVFERLPLRVLETAAAQLESLIESPVLPGVAALRSRLAVEILSREKSERPFRTAATRANAEVPSAAPHEEAAVARPGPARGAAAAAVAPAAAAASADASDTDTATAGPPSTFAMLSAWEPESTVEIREASEDDFERATTEWQLLDEPRQA